VEEAHGGSALRSGDEGECLGWPNTTQAPRTTRRPPPATPARDSSPEIARPLAGLSVLLVADDLRVHHDYVAWLDAAGASVQGVWDYPSALLAWRRERRHAIVTDNMVPDGSGIQLLALIDRLDLDHPSDPVPPPDPAARVLVTAYPMGSTFELELQERGSVILHKPLTAETLIRAVLLARERTLSPPTRATPLRADPARILAKGPVRIDTWTGRVTVKFSEVKLPPKPHSVLAWLLANQGSVVSEAELLEVVWRTHHADESSAVRNAISTLRALLGFPGNSFIETALDGRGWRIPLFP